jgi:subtilisin family serine protease
MLSSAKSTGISGRTWRWSLCCAIALFGLTGSIAGKADIVRGHILVRIGGGEDVNDLSDDYGSSVDAAITGQRIYALHTPDGTDEVTFAEQLSGDPRVVYAVPDTTINLPDVHGTQFHLAFDAGPDPGDYVNQHAFQQIHIGSALTKTTGTGVIVAVLDTGASYDHPALAGHYIAGYNAIQPQNSPDDVADGLLNAAVGHGTMIAGIIVQVAPAAQILPVRVLDGDGNGTVLNVISGLDYAVNHGARIINMSFGATESSPALADALARTHDTGVLLIASAGNDGANQVNYPAAYRGVVAVTAIEETKHKSAYANFGPQIAVVAPGTGIRSTYIDQGYATWSGTSFSAPFVSAEAALVLSLRLDGESDDIKERVRETAHSVDKLNPQWAGMLGHGLIDVEAAVIDKDD